MALHTPVIVWKLKYLWCFIISHVKLVTQQYESIGVQKLLCNQSNHYKNTDDFHCEKKPSHATTRSTLLLSAKMNGTQRRTLMISPALHVLWHAKRYLSGREAMCNSEKIIPVASIYAGLKAYVSQSVRQTDRQAGS